MNRPLIGISGSHNVADRQMFVRENYISQCSFKLYSKG